MPSVGCSGEGEKGQVRRGLREEWKGRERQGREEKREEERQEAGEGEEYSRDHSRGWTSQVQGLPGPQSTFRKGDQMVPHGGEKGKEEKPSVR